jgi:hypothetical protein
MRKRFSVKLLIVTVLTLVGFLMVQQFFAAFGSSATNKTNPDKADSVLGEIAKYRKWTLVNPTPIMMNPGAAAACAVYFPINPHETKYVSVYVNPKGASAMMTQDQPRFPEGSIIVKEKLGYILSKKPELLTVMIKREAGYNPESRDWEYLVLDGPASEIIERGKLARCNECHLKYVNSDFVTMLYRNPKPRAR